MGENLSGMNLALPYTGGEYRTEPTDLRYAVNNTQVRKANSGLQLHTV